MSYFITIDSEGFGTGFFSEAGFPPLGDKSRNPAIPASAISVEKADFDALMQGRAKYLDGAVQAYTPSPLPVVVSDIDRERDRRIVGGFMFGTVLYQSDAESIANILGAAQLAFMAIVGGAKAGDMSWAGGPGPFAWIAADNSRVQMDAQTVVGFAKAAAAFRSQIIYAARNLKDALAAGQQVDVHADASWGM